MFRILSLVALLGSALISSSSAQFSWDITPIDGYPVIAFDEANTDSEVVLRYNYTGTIVENSKYITPTILQTNCLDAADGSLSLTEVPDYPSQEYQLDVDIDTDTIADSVHYTSPSDTTAEIKFCVRVDYVYKDESDEVMSVNFHETVLTITVDLTKNFTLESISTDRTDAKQDAANAELDYPVEAYYCNEQNTEMTPDAFSQGSALQVCVRIPDTVTESVYVKDVLRFVLSQPEANPAVAESVNINGGNPDPLTAKDCTYNSMGICNVKTQLASKWFTADTPKPLQVDGIALLSFGTPARRLRAVRISGSIAYPDRKLQEEEEGSNGENPFQLEVGLASDATPAVQQQAPPVAEEAPAADNSILIIGIVAFIVVLMVLLCMIGVCVYCCCFAGGTSKKNKEAEYEDEYIRQYAASMNGVDYSKEAARSGQMPAQFY